MHLFTVPSKSSIILSYADKPGLVGSTNAAALETLTSGVGSSSLGWTVANSVLLMDGDDTSGPAKAYFLNDDSSSFRNLNGQRVRDTEKDDHRNQVWLQYKCIKQIHHQMKMKIPMLSAFNFKISSFN